MKSMKRALESIRSTPFRSLFLGLVLAVLSAGQAGAISGDEDRLFRFAAHDKDNGTVRQLLAEGVSPNAAGNFDGRTAVHSAAKGGAAKNLAAMLQAGGKPNVQDRDGDTPLHLASRGSYAGGFSDHSAAVQVLLQHGADLHRTNNSGETPLHVAVFTGVGAAHVFVIKALLDAGARPSAVDGNGLTVLQRFSRHSENNGAIVRLLLQAGADPDRKDPRGDAPLHAAIKSGGSYGKAEVVEALLDGGANPCVRDDRGYTPYHMSSDLNRIHRALDQAGGADASHAGGSGCQLGSADGPEMTEKGAEGEQNAGESVAALGPLCANAAEGAECWKVVSNKPGCYVFDNYLKPDQSYTWSGDCVDGKVSGEGREVWRSSDGEIVYEGSMRDGKRNGQGTYTWPSGNRYEGEWRDGKRNGQGTYTWPSGNRYEGEWRDGKFHGQGTFTGANGDRYEGSMRADKRHGQGIFTWANGDRYEGEYRDGKPHGQGTFTKNDGERYEGEWQNGCFGTRDGEWATITTTKEACGFE